MRGQGGERQKRYRKTAEIYTRLSPGIITDVLLDIYSEEEKQNFQVCEINRTTKNKINVEGTLKDSRLGTITESKRCGYCHLGSENCMGHFGIINFKNPVYNPKFIKKVIEILTTRCLVCATRDLETDEILSARSILSNTVLENLSLETKYKKSRLNTIVIESKGQSCSNINIKSNQICGAKSYNYKKIDSEKLGQIKYTYGSGAKKTEGEIKAKEALNILRKISIRDARNLGFEIFEKEIDGEIIVYHKLTAFIYESLLVPPKKLRPYVEYRQSVKSRYSMLGKIIEANANLYSISEGEEREKMKLLYDAIVNYSSEIDSDLGGKTGSLRMVWKKRVNFSGRVTINNDPGNGLDTVSLPVEMAVNLTPVKLVTSVNINHYQLLVLMGKVKLIKKYNGVELNIKQNNLPRTDEEMFDKLNNLSNWKYKLDPGDEIHRYMANEDYIIANRNPTLHRYNIMAFRILLKYGKTMGFPPLAAGPFNADFDGDEMNIHVPISDEEMKEAKTILYVCNNFESTKNGNINMGLILDNVEAAFLMSFEDEIIPEYYIDIAINKLRFSYDTDLETELFRSGGNLGTVFDTSEFLEVSKKLQLIRKFYSTEYTKDIPNLQQMIYDHVKNWREGLKKYGIHPQSPRALFSLAFPSNFNYNKSGIVIYDGIFISGILKKSHVGASQAPIIKFMTNRYTGQEIGTFLSNLDMVTNIYISDFRGITVSPNDCDFMMTDDVRKRKEKIFKDLEKELIGIELTENVDKEFKIKSIISAVNNTDSLIRKLTKISQSKSNNIYIGKESKAKGSESTNVQLTGNTGQIWLSNRLPSESLSGDRLSAYFKKGEISVASLGYSTRSFFEGLIPRVNFIAAMAGRESLISNVLVTPSSGDLSRILSRFLVSVITETDGSVRVGKFIVQFVYGQYGFDTRKLFPTPNKNDTNNMSFIDLDFVSKNISKEFGWYLLPKKININGRVVTSVEEELDLTKLDERKYFSYTKMVPEKEKLTYEDAILFIKEDIYPENLLVRFEHKNKNYIKNVKDNGKNLFEFTMEVKEYILTEDENKTILEDIFSKYNYEDKYRIIFIDLINSKLQSNIQYKNFFDYLEKEDLDIEEFEDELMEYIEDRNDISKYFYDLTKKLFTYFDFEKIKNLIEILNKYKKVETVEDYIKIFEDKTLNEETIIPKEILKYIHYNTDILEYIKELEVYFHLITLSKIRENIRLWYINFSKYLFLVRDITLYTDKIIIDKFYSELDIENFDISVNIFTEDLEDRVIELLLDFHEDYVEEYEKLKENFEEIGLTDFIINGYDYENIDLLDNKAMLEEIFVEEDNIAEFIDILYDSLSDSKYLGYPLDFILALANILQS